MNDDDASRIFRPKTTKAMISPLASAKATLHVQRRCSTVSTKLSAAMPAKMAEQAAKSLLTPCVKVFYSTKSKTRIVPEIIDLSQASCQDKIVSREDPRKWNFPDLNELWSGITSPNTR